MFTYIVLLILAAGLVTVVHMGFELIKYTLKDL